MTNDSNTTFNKKDSKTNTSDDEAISLSKKVFSVVAADLQNPDSKDYAQSVLKRAMGT